MRTRTGCNKCRQRKVKCPEQKPICKPCLLLGFSCNYSTTLRWQDVEVAELPDIDYDPTTGDNPVAEWMFLNVTSHDFETAKLPSSPSTTTSTMDLDVSLDRESSEQANNASSPSLSDDASSRAVTIWLSRGEKCKVYLQPWISPLSTTPQQLRLWTFFQDAIAPTCVVNPAMNPYRDIILRIAASKGDTSPLFQSIMAISTSQLHLLGSQDFLSSSCDYRHHAIRSLRLETAKVGYEIMPPDASSATLIIATIIALMFLDILSHCSPSWVIHSKFARFFIQDFRQKFRPKDPDIEALLNFAGAYIIVHDVYAHSAWSATRDDTLYIPVNSLCDDYSLQTLTGCSTEFFQILSDINTLALDKSQASELGSPDPSVTDELQHHRKDIERRLHAWAIDGDIDEPNYECLPKDLLVIEAKRLTGLLHLYSRLDNLGPQDPRITRLSTDILYLVSLVPARTITILWPLFMVATVGIRPEADDQRAFILQKLDFLQNRRQMRHLTKARRIIERVWKVRDLQDPLARMAWDILPLVARNERISLL